MNSKHFSEKKFYPSHKSYLLLVLILILTYLYIYIYLLTFSSLFFHIFAFDRRYSRVELRYNRDGLRSNRDGLKAHVILVNFPLCTGI